MGDSGAIQVDANRLKPRRQLWYDFFDVLIERQIDDASRIRRVFNKPLLKNGDTLAREGRE